MVQLEAVNLFHGLPEQELADLREIAQKRRFAGGTQIFPEGDLGDGLYVIAGGQVQIAHLVAGEIRHVFSTLGPGDVFGEMAVIEENPRSATALAAADTELYFIPREAMRRFLQRSPVLAFNLLHMVSHRLREFNQLHLREIVQSESLALLGRFAQGVVHDIKNPLNIISLCSELYEMPNANPAIRATAHTRIRKQVERINNLVTDILIFAEGKRRSIPLETVNYAVFIQNLLPDLKTEAEMKSAAVELQSSVPGVQVALDARRLNRVFFNLLNNATDFMPEGGRIFLRCRVEGNELVTEIEDTGPGIPPEMTDKLFQAFATHGKAHGTGLGLSICKKIVEDHSGRIWAKNEPGRGAIFCFALPLAKQTLPRTMPLT